jgi:primosomal protein N' (replication factor Y)
LGGAIRALAIVSSDVIQPGLFDASLPDWEADSADERPVAEVVFAKGYRQSLIYTIPDRLVGEVAPGKRVVVPLGKHDRRVTGYCVAVRTAKSTGTRLKGVSAVLDPVPLFTPIMLRVTHWIAEYYLRDWGEVLEGAVPAGVRGQAGTREARYLAIPDEVRRGIAVLKLPEKQRRVVEFLSSKQVPVPAADVARECGCTAAPIRALEKKGLVTSEIRRTRTSDYEEAHHAPAKPHSLNRDQTQALDAILDAMRGKRPETILIHGVTGSGKTEVYMKAIDEVVSYGRQAIVLVPEISLTPQTRERFCSRFSRVAVLHSHLSDAERHWQWERIARGEIQVVVGARSAVFAPTPHLGLIIMDEEHEPSFKQESVPRYHARTVAIQRTRELNIPLVLGTATPCLESWWAARQPGGRLIEMPRRVLDRPLPSALTVDLRAQDREFSRGAISRMLHQAMEKTLRGNGQIILLLNRRGFSTHVQCPHCGQTLRCPECDIALTHHRQGESVRCHYCDYAATTPDVCPECRDPGIRFHGFGTQKLEAEVRARFPDMPSLRMDTDTMQGAGSHARALDKFRRGEARILLGTQMIAKGLDFPDVTLVGVINADVGLHLPDFRAAERTFQLITQVAGRTGRGPKGGRVLVQTFTPEHPAIQAAVRHSFPRFAESELPIRRQFGYPPYGEVLRIIVRGAPTARVKAFTEHVRDALFAELGKRQADQGALRISGPAPAPIARLRGKYRFHLLLRAPSLAETRAVLDFLRHKLEPPDDVEWVIDVDPLSML